MRMICRTPNEDRALKEQIGCRVETHVKRILEQIAKDEFRTVANVTEKLICERLRDMGLLDKDFGPVGKQNEVEQDAPEFGEEEKITQGKEG